MADQEQPREATLPGVRPPAPSQLPPPPAPSQPSQPGPPASGQPAGPAIDQEGQPRARRGRLGRLDHLARQVRSGRPSEGQEDVDQDPPDRRRRVRIRTTSSGEFSSLTPEELNSIEGATAAALVVASRILDWAANKTVLRGKGRDLVVTPGEARRLAKPIGRFFVNRVEIDGLSVLEKRDTIAAGVAGGAYAHRVVAGRPGGREGSEADEVIDQALEDAGQ